MTLTRTLTAYTILLLLLVAFPQIAGAAYLGVIDTFLANLGSFIGAYVIPLIFGLALVVFVWGMFTYLILGGGDEKKREEGKALALWAIIGLTVMVVIWGLVNLIAGGLLTGLGQNDGAGQQGGLDILPETPTQ